MLALSEDQSPPGRIGRCIHYQEGVYSYQTLEADLVLYHSSHSETGACLEYLLKNDVLSTLERISENDRPTGIRAEVLNAFNLLVALLDEKFLVHNAVGLRSPLSPLSHLLVVVHSSTELDWSRSTGSSTSSTLASELRWR